MDSKTETIINILKVAKIRDNNPDGFDRKVKKIVDLSSKFLNEMIDAELSPDDTFSVISTMLSASLLIFGLEKDQSEKLLIEIFKMIHKKI